MQWELCTLLWAWSLSFRDVRVFQNCNQRYVLVKRTIASTVYPSWILTKSKGNHIGSALVTWSAVCSGGCFAWFIDIPWFTPTVSMEMNHSSPAGTLCALWVALQGLQGEMKSALPLSCFSGLEGRREWGHVSRTPSVNLISCSILSRVNQLVI